MSFLKRKVSQEDRAEAKRLFVRGQALLAQGEDIITRLHQAADRIEYLADREEEQAKNGSASSDG